MEGKPRADLTIVEIGLAVAGVGFLIADRPEPELQAAGSLVFFFAASSSLFMYFVYIFEWADTYVPDGQEWGRKERLLWAAYIGIGLALIGIALALASLSAQRLF